MDETLTMRPQRLRSWHHQVWVTLKKPFTDTSRTGAIVRPHAGEYGVVMNAALLTRIDGLVFDHRIECLRDAALSSRQHRVSARHHCKNAVNHLLRRRHAMMGMNIDMTAIGRESATDAAPMPRCTGNQCSFHEDSPVMCVPRIYHHGGAACQQQLPQR